MCKWKPDVEFQYGGRFGEFNGTSSQSHVSHCRVLPLGEFTVTIPEPHATLQDAVTWRNLCRERATLQGVKISSAILKIVFRHIILIVLMQFRLWRAAAFVSSQMHFFSNECVCLKRFSFSHLTSYHEYIHNCVSVHSARHVENYRRSTFCLIIREPT